ncbi:hypothetical protein ZIOFF_062811 [Zingiber officinale]|uniref:Uncharacterized protein n=1 Tax=Zingiber officinale TaxID=94328 RepID=A0A8J5F5Y4_ZINOF|nr:hypothetical protein ZIOFF_062811 [Zingiber officinale]
MTYITSELSCVLAEQGFSKLTVLMCISSSICFSAISFVYQMQGLKHGRVIMVFTCAAVSAIITGVLTGMITRGERLALFSNCSDVYLLDIENALKFRT